VDEQNKPELRLFVSFDIEGSTHFKQSADEGSRVWGPFFRSFFEKFPGLVKRVESKILTDIGLPQSRSKLEVWKILGDEIIFQKPIIGGLDAFVGTVASRQALIEGTQLLRESGGDRERREKHDGVAYPSQLKATAWTAGFPNKNILLKNIGAGIAEDFIGPSIDLGFRISKLATPARMPISLTLAYMLAETLQDIRFRTQIHRHACGVELCYLGRESLKGINKDTENYPVFFLKTIEAVDTLASAEESLTGKANLINVTKFCKECNGFMGSPFVLNDIDGLFPFFDESNEAATQYIQSYKATLLPEKPTDLAQTIPEDAALSDLGKLTSIIDEAAQHLKDHPS